MNKALKVLSACVDIRNGKRFEAGDEFAPPPNPEQAKRLVDALCLPKEAIEAAVAAETEAEKAAEKKAANERAEREKAEAEAKAAAEAAAKKAAEKKA